MPETVAGLMRRAANQLSLRGIETAALDARLLLQAAASITHADIVAEPDLILPAEVTAGFWLLVERRCTFEPVSRILGTREFYGRNFRVTPDVLDPRADTETLIGAVLALAKGRGPLRILDLGTGSGAIVMTLLAELPEALAVATDLSAAALQVAKGNAEALGVANRVRFARANWFDGVDGQFDFIVSNPPYIPLGDIAGLAVDVRDFDPHKGAGWGARWFGGLSPHCKRGWGPFSPQGPCYSGDRGRPGK